MADSKKADTPAKPWERPKTPSAEKVVEPPPPNKPADVGTAPPSDTPSSSDDADATQLTDLRRMSMVYDLLGVNLAPDVLDVGDLKQIVVEAHFAKVGGVSSGGARTLQFNPATGVSMDDFILSMRGATEIDTLPSSLAEVSFQETLVAVVNGVPQVVADKATLNSVREAIRGREGEVSVKYVLIPSSHISGNRVIGT